VDALITADGLELGESVAIDPNLTLRTVAVVEVGAIAAGSDAVASLATRARMATLERDRLPSGIVASPTSLAFSVEWR